ncbi:MAG: hypothetical protein K2F70_05380 [Muribaculaceae bacterium]|nr:hypothetical protein [Muribaculaceae bacterium]
MSRRYGFSTEHPPNIQDYAAAPRSSPTGANALIVKSVGMLPGASA